MLVRRAVAVGIGVLILVLFAVGVRSCQNSRKERALKDYNRDVASLIKESDSQVGKPFFELLTASGASSPLDLQTEVNQLRVVAEELVKRARKLSPPDEMKPAHRYLILTLELRRDGVGRIAEKLPTALGKDGAEDALAQIAGQMRAFDAADVIYSQRVIPLIGKALDDASIGGQTIATSQFLPNLGWLNAGTVAARLGSSVKGGGGQPAPGTHGHGLVSVSVGTLALQPGGAANRIPAAANLAFDVKFANQGENDEVDVAVRVRIEGAGKPIQVQKSIDQTKRGAESTVSIPLGQSPPIGTPVTIVVEVAPVPGEKKTDNNKQSYTAIFTR